MITAYAVDDDAGALAILVDFCNRTEGVQLLGHETDPVKAVTELQSLSPDVLFVDVQMPKLNGFELLEIVQPGPSVIFTTSFGDFAVKAFEKNAVDYLHKPFGYARFLKAVYKARRIYDRNLQSYTSRRIPVKITGKGNYAFLYEKDIEMLESQGGLVIATLIGGETFTCSETFEEMLRRLKGGSIFQIHRSFAVNVEQIRSISAKQVTLKNKKIVQVGDMYRQDLYGLIHEDQDD